MAYNSRQSNDVQALCEYIIRINEGWYNTIRWDYPGFRHDLMCSLPNSIYFSYEENIANRYLDTSVLMDIYNAINDMVNLKPVRYGIACYHGLVYEPSDPWCYILGGLDGLVYPQRYVLDQSPFLDRLNSLLPDIESYWYKAWCDADSNSDPSPSACEPPDCCSTDLIECLINLDKEYGLDLSFGSGIVCNLGGNCHNLNMWAWNLRDLFLDLLNYSDIRKDLNSIYEFSVDNVPAKGEVITFLNDFLEGPLDYNEVVCCSEIDILKNIFCSLPCATHEYEICEGWDIIPSSYEYEICAGW